MNYIELVRKSKILFSVFRFPVQNAEEIVEPADELIVCLERSLGQTIPQYEDGYPVSLILHLDPAVTVEREEFIIRSRKNEIRLVAKTRQGMFHAVYYFLENILGVRWLWPGSDGEVVPKHKDLKFPVGTIREKPDFKWRALQVGGALYGQKGGLDQVTMRHAVLGLPLSYQKEFEQWCRRTRFGGLKISDGHRWCEIAPPEVYGKTHPEYYALLKGKRDCLPYDGKHGNQPCLSNDDVVELMVEYVCSRFEADPDLDACSIALNDGNQPCECEGCMKESVFSKGKEGFLDEITNEISNTGRTTGERNISDLVYKNANRVIKKVKKRFPDRKLLILLYTSFRNPPRKSKLHPDVIGQYCIMGNSLCNRDILNTEKKNLKKVGEKVPALGIYEYYSNGKWPEIHRLFPEVIATSVNMYYNAGARYFATQPGMGFAVNGLNLYLLGRLLWNRKQDVSELIKTYCDSGFGTASKHMENYFSAFAERWKETESGTKLSQTPEGRLALAELYDKRFLNERKKDIQCAKEKAKNDTQVKRRINFIEKGLTYTSLYCKALRDTRALYDLVPPGELAKCELPWKCLTKIRKTKQLKRNVSNALRSWECYWGFVRKNMGKFVFGDFWVNYRPGVFGTDDQTIIQLEKLNKDLKV